MDIQEIINYSKNKIEADDLAKQVRRRIKETAWEKRNRREGFSETFKPLISQFEKPDDPKKKNIFTQNQEMLRNQLALTEGLRDNQKAITEGFKQFERLADKKELPQIEYDDLYYNYFLKEKQREEEAKKAPTLYDVEKKFDEQDMKYLSYFGYPRPNDFFDIETTKLQKIYDEVINDKNIIGHRMVGLKRRKNKTEDEEKELDEYTSQHGF